MPRILSRTGHQFLETAWARGSPDPQRRRVDSDGPPRPHGSRGGRCGSGQPRAVPVHGPNAGPNVEVEASQEPLLLSSESLVDNRLRQESDPARTSME